MFDEGMDEEEDDKTLDSIWAFALLIGEWMDG